MKKVFRKSLVMLLTLAMLLSSLGALSFTASAASVNNLVTNGNFEAAVTTENTVPGFTFEKENNKITLKIKIEKADLFHGSGAIFCENDEIIFEDAIKCMLLCSSNQSAQAVARTVTEIIKTKNRPQ